MFSDYYNLIFSNYYIENQMLFKHNGSIKTLIEILFLLDGSFEKDKEYNSIKKNLFSITISTFQNIYFLYSAISFLI